MSSKIKLIIAFITTTFLINGCKKEDKKTDPIPIANFTYSGDTIPAPAILTFTNISTDATSYMWDFGDQGTSTAISPQHTYDYGGVYTVKLIANGIGGIDSITKTLTINDTPTSCSIKGMILNAMPFVNLSGAPFDSTHGPDVYYWIMPQGGGTPMSYSLPINNVDSASLPISWNPFVTPYPISDLSKNYAIDFFDDDPIGSDQGIGGFIFKPSDFIPAYLDTVILTHQSLTLTLMLEWQ